LKVWNKEVFGYMDRLKLDLLNEIQVLEQLDDVDNLEKNKIWD